ncbi:MAG: DnaJ domain-containing protein [Roseburia sp.]|nr:DnaJ domain-containing protein [Roseburia sp.]
MKNYYNILGIDRQASKDQIKKAYRKLAKQYHPDVVKDDEEKQKRMYEIQEAYECLGDEERRKKYDESVLRKNPGGEKKAAGNKPGHSAQKRQDMSQFEQFFGFQPGKGMETYHDKGMKNPEKSFHTDEMFAAFFGIKNQKGDGK